MVLPPGSKPPPPGITMEVDGGSEEAADVAMVLLLAMAASVLEAPDMIRAAVLVGVKLVASRIMPDEEELELLPPLLPGGAGGGAGGPLVALGGSKGGRSRCQRSASTPGWFMSGSMLSSGDRPQGAGNDNGEKVAGVSHSRDRSSGLLEGRTGRSQAGMQACMQEAGRHSWQ